MKRFTLETLGYITFTLGLILVIGSQFKGCQTDQIPESQASLSVEQIPLSVEQNFKLWTEDDFKQAEVDPLDVSYHNPCQTACPNNITADDLAIINQHHQKQMQRLVAGGK